MRTQRWIDREGDVVHEYTLEPSGRLTRRVLRASGRQVLEHNQRRRLEPDSMRKLDWGTMALQIPEADYHILRSKYPELACWDNEVKKRAWKKFIASRESLPYRVKERP